MLALPLLSFVVAVSQAWPPRSRWPWSQAASPREPVKLPDYVEVCARNDPNLGGCLKDTLQTLIPKLKDGEPSLDLPPLDPFVVPEMLVEYRQGDVRGKMLVKNSKSYGLTNLLVKDVRVNLNDSGLYRMEVDIHLPKVFIEGDYKAQGKIVVFPINGKGVYNISMSEVTATWNLTGEYFRKQRQTFVRITHFEMFPEIGDMKLYASNLFTGNDDFNKAALAFANEFWQVLYSEMLPYVNEGWDKVMRGVVNKVFLQIPFTQLFPRV